MPFSAENLTENERLIYQAVLQAAKEGMENYFGMNGEQHKLDHMETIPALKKVFDDNIREVVTKNIFWQEVKKDLYKFLFRALALMIIAIILVRVGITEWSTVVKFIGF